MRWVSMALLISVLDTVGALFSSPLLEIPTDASLSLKGAKPTSNACSKAEITSARKVDFLSALQRFARSISEFGRSMVVLIHKSIFHNMCLCKLNMMDVD